MIQYIVVENKCNFMPNKEIFKKPIKLQIKKSITLNKIKKMKKLKKYGNINQQNMKDQKCYLGNILFYIILNYVIFY